MCTEGVINLESCSIAPSAQTDGEVAKYTVCKPCIEGAINLESSNMTLWLKMCAESVCMPRGGRG